MGDLSGNNFFYQLSAANSSGDYLTLKKARAIYANDKNNTTINTKTVPYLRNRSHSKMMLFNKGYFQNTVCDDRTTNSSLLPYGRSQTYGMAKQESLATGSIQTAISTTSGTLESDASSKGDGFYVGKTIELTSGTSIQTRTIIRYDEKDRSFTIDGPALNPALAAGNTYKILNTVNNKSEF